MALCIAHPEAEIETYFNTIFVFQVENDKFFAFSCFGILLLVWNQHSQQPILKLTEHTAAVKAIAWSPHQNGLLASGGTADQCICFWNTTSGNQINGVDTKSQVCNLAWSKNVNELVNSHGYSQNQIMVWNYPSMAKVATLTLPCISPDGQTIVTD
ncbi:unnamed protein product [Fraxinus pennsylvanica]|uniref:Uncharacterized protein n=1 Tax=Fraxinus pennsylvanica TaxID=56036 RepID=A0AAD2E4W6_9LAMI|nr:unnamed protein product [Fraxinus pennsylvanica]